MARPYWLTLGAVFILITLSSLWAAPVALAQSGAAPVSNALETFHFIAATRLPTGLRFSGTEIGGLSGMTYDPAREKYYIVSDARRQPRFYTATLEIGTPPLEPEDIQFEAVTFLKTKTGQPMAPLLLDPEGIALSPDNTLFISSEGDANQLINPLIGEFSLQGQKITELPLLQRILPSPDRSTGIRNNLAFENLSLTPGGRFLITGTENALYQDGPAANLQNGSPVRILKYDLISQAWAGEFIYETDAVAATPLPSGAFSTNGLVELLALDSQGTTLLTLERGFSVGVGNTARLYWVTLATATDVSALDSIQETEIPIVSAEKKLVLDLSRLNLPQGLDNLEGMTWGPELPNGQRSLILVSDNNFNRDQFTQFIVLGLDP